MFPPIKHSLLLRSGSFLATSSSSLAMANNSRDNAKDVDDQGYKDLKYGDFSGHAHGGYRGCHGHGYYRGGFYGGQGRGRGCGGYYEGFGDHGGENQGCQGHSDGHGGFYRCQGRGCGGHHIRGGCCGGHGHGTHGRGFKM
ncbi:hypothetical protein ZOSMA_29G00480 [Zostera marina]|uniref:Uncharacterized protein n=1 Tax=Zostera marina TaxID=29655 RepID=A0A0K9PBP3_ZOSMR|nr:hypothetical protein ZOSMA_29G00480 [Zostera marina]